MTISHYELPYYLAKEYGGWANREITDFFLRYCKTLFTEFKGQVHYWLTFNEINILQMGAYGNLMGGPSNPYLEQSQWGRPEFLESGAAYFATAPSLSIPVRLMHHNRQPSTYLS